MFKKQKTSLLNTMSPPVSQPGRLVPSYGPLNPARTKSNDWIPTPTQTQLNTRSHT